MNNEEKIAVLADLFEVEQDELTVDTVLAEMDEWDSLSKLSLMAMMKKKFGKSLTVDEIRTFVTVEDICRYMV